jgi:hypothetical protein
MSLVTSAAAGKEGEGRWNRETLIQKKAYKFIFGGVYWMAVKLETSTKTRLSAS